MRTEDYGARGVVLLAVLGLLVPSSLALLAGPAAAGSGGPDAYGYTWVDNRLPGPGVEFTWVDGVTGGTDLGLSDDGCTSNRISFGFPFRFYGLIHSNAYVCANGFIAFNTPAGRAFLTDEYAAAMDADLDPSASGSGPVYAKADASVTPRRFIVTWAGTYTYATTERQEFQIILHENPTGDDGRIQYQYRDVTNPPLPLVGIANLTKSSTLYYTEPLEDQLAVLFVPPTATLPGDSLVLQGASLAPGVVEPGMADVPMLRLNLSTATNSVIFRQIRVDVTGVRSGIGDVSRIALWRDTDGDGLLNTSADTFLVAAQPGGPPENAVLTLPVPMTISAGVGATVLIAFDVPLSAVPDDWIGAGVLSPSYVTVDPPDTVSPVNFPFDSYVANVRTLILEGIDTLRLTSWNATNPANVTQWQQDVGMVRLGLESDKGAVTITSLNATLEGSPSNPADVRLVKWFLDDGDDQFVPETDLLLGLASPNATGIATLPGSLTVLAGTPVTAWIAVDLAPNATTGNVVALRIPNPGAVGLQGSKDVMAPDNFPVNTSASTILSGSVPSLLSRWALSPPLPTGRIGSGEYVVAPENSVDFATVGGNEIAGRLIVQNDGTFLYVAVDATGDQSAGASDVVSLAFDTNDTAPGARPDDQFVGGSLTQIHAFYNATMGDWEIEDACLDIVDANHTGLACSVAFAGSPYFSTPHRMYEFRIPLVLLEVPLPIPPGYTLGFATLSRWFAGVWDGDSAGTNHWPLPEPSIPPVWYGNLTLASAPPANTPPTLNWTGEPGYATDGVSPNQGVPDTPFVFRILYTDLEGDFPSLGEPRLHVLEGALDIPGSPFALGEADPLDLNVMDGKIYARVVTFPDCPRSYTYFFSAADDRGAIANITSVLPGPNVVCPPSAPVLGNDTVNPAVGFVDRTAFEWSVEYRDSDGDAPALLYVTIWKGAVEVANRSASFRSWIGTPGNYTQGASYGASGSLSAEGSDYSFSFFADDGNLSSSTPPRSGPTVLPEPADTLLISFADQAPLVQDQGRRNVTMFTAILQADANTVDVVGLRIDRAGASVDSDVASVALYHDVDRTGSLSAPDLILGRGAFTTGSVQFGFLVQVAAGTTEQLLIVLDVSSSAVADNRIGLRVLDASYVTVSAPDKVGTFAAFQTTAFLVNVPPQASGLTVDGAVNGSGPALHVTTGTPVLAWVFSDPNVNTLVQSGFNVSVFAQATGSLLWFRNETGSTSSVPYGGPALTDGESYRMVVRVFDGRIWGASASLWFRLNTPPSSPSLSSPPANATDLGPISVTLQWATSQDAEDDPLSYRWFLSTTPDFATPVSGTTVSTSVIVTTLGATTYYWRVEADDGYETSAPSTARMFETAPTGGIIRGRVIGGGQPLLAVVRLLDGTGAQFSELATDATGQFTFADVPFGLYTVQVSSVGYEPLDVTGIVITSTDPVENLGDLTLQAIPGPDSPDWMQGLLWIIVVIALLVAAVGSLLSGLVLRRAQRQEPLLPEGAEGIVEEPARDPDAPERVHYECPRCQTVVEPDSKVCPGCGAFFE